MNPTLLIKYSGKAAVGKGRGGGGACEVCYLIKWGLMVNYFKAFSPCLKV